MDRLHAVLRSGLFSDGPPTLFVWMETRAPVGNGDHDPYRYPYACPASHVQKELMRRVDTAISGYSARTTLFFPTSDAGPSPYQSLEDQPLWLEEYTLEGIWIHRSSLRTFMQRVWEMLEQKGPVEIAADLAFLAGFTQWVLRKVDALEIVPDLRYDDTASLGTWCLLPREHIARELRRWAQAAPLALFAHYAHGLAVAGSMRRAELLIGYADVVIDTEVRRRLSAQEPIRLSHHRLITRWVNALQASDGVMYGSPALRGLAISVGQWQMEGVQFERLLRNVRLVLQLMPLVDDPAEDGLVTAGAWELRYALFDPKRPDRNITAAEVWESDNPAYTAALRRLLLQAGWHFRPIARSLDEEEPVGCRLASDEVADFIQKALDPLAGEGVVIQLPAWLESRPRPLRARVVVDPGHGRLSLDTLVSFEWQAAIGDRELSPEEFERLLRARLPYVRLGNEWVVLEPEAIRKLLERADRLGSVVQGRTPVVELADIEEEIDLRAESEESIQRFRLLMAGLSQDRKWELLPPPDGLRAVLRPYQERGYSWLCFMRALGLGACLADDMGLGKTLQVIALLQREKERGGMEGPVLVVCPVSVVENWRRELRRFAPELRVHVHHGSERLRGEALTGLARTVDVVLTSYGLVLRDIEDLQKIDWDTVVVDEAQHLKNPASKQTRSVKRLPARHRIALTGTPIENRLIELWSIFDFLQPGYLGGLTRFRQEVATPIERRGDERRMEWLRRRIHPLILRRSKSDPQIAPELPDKLESKVYCTLTAEQAALYQAVVEQMMQRIEGASGLKRRGLVLASLTRLKQICNHPALFLREPHADVNRSGKMQALVEHVRQVLELGESALLFTQYAQMGRLLQRTLREELEGEVFYLHGGVARAERDRLVERFQAGEAPLFILSLRAGGVGLNLTRATHVFHFDRWWNPAVENQATDRAYRIGQDREVNVYKFICTGTLEDHIDDLIEEKQALADQLIHSGEQWLSELDNATLRRIFSLDHEVVA